MINICIDYKENIVEIEGELPVKLPVDKLTMITFITSILNKAYFSGERLCLEIKDEDGLYTTINRWE